MSTIEHITSPPQNFDRFVEEVSEGFRQLYGPAAAEYYRRTVRLTTPRSMRHPNVQILAYMDGPDAQAMLYSVRRDQVGQITFMHVLTELQGTGLEEDLMRSSVESMRRNGITGITSECVPFCKLELDHAYTDLGFTRIERQLMTTTLNTPPLTIESARSRPCTENDTPAIAEILTDAYRGHPERALHVDMTTPRLAEAFVRSTFAGGYGPTQPAFVRMIEENGMPAAVVLGCRIAADLGFVLQLAVRRSAQARGLGTRLLNELGGAFLADDIARMALGVTLANPARELYERQGFSPVRRINAYTWWQGYAQL